MVTLSFTIFSGQKNYNRAHMLFQVLCGFEPIFYTTHPNEESLIIEYKRNRNEFILSNKIIFYQIKNSKNLVRLLKLFNCNFNTLLEFETFLFIVAIVHL